MAGGRSFKSDESFLEKISMGAIGTQTVFKNLLDQGHDPIELERGSRSFKIWKSIKIKRVRVPDILCVKCGTRIESRAKKNFEISMSHSIADPNRGWDAGLKNSDRVALVKCKKVGPAPIDWKATEPVQYLTVKDMRNAYQANKVNLKKPKGAEEGFEMRVTWYASVAGFDGMVSYVSPEKLQYKRAQDGRTITIKMHKNNVSLTPMVKVGDQIKEGQILGAVVPIAQVFKCSNDKDLDYYKEQLKGIQISDRYSAIKAISKIGAGDVRDLLKQKMNDQDEHIYVRLEAAAALMRINDQEGIDFIRNMTNNEYLEHRLETVIILSEIRNKTSLALLRNVLFDAKQHPEIRAAAAWSLGELGLAESIDILVQVFNEVDNNVKIEAARSIAKLADDNTDKLIKEFRNTSEKQRPGVAWALSRKGKFTIDELLPCLKDLDTRQWVSYIIGFKRNGNEKEFINEIEKLKEKDKEVYFAVTVLWKILSSWIYNLEEY